MYEAIMAAGAEYGIAPAGYYAIDGLRLEKGNRAWGRDLTPDVTPLEAGLARFTKLGTSLPFRGRAALERQAAAPPSQRLIDFQVEDPDATLWGGGGIRSRAGTRSRRCAATPWSLLPETARS